MYLLQSPASVPAVTVEFDSGRALGGCYQCQQNFPHSSGTARRRAGGLVGSGVRRDWQSKPRCLLGCLRFVFCCSLWMSEIKHSNKVFGFNFHTGSPSRNLSCRFRFLRKAWGGVPEWCICNIKFNVPCNSFSWLTNFWSKVVLKFHFGLNIILYFFFL